MSGVDPAGAAPFDLAAHLRRDLAVDAETVEAARVALTL